MEDAHVSSSNSSSFIQDCSKDERPGKVNYETCLPDLGEKPNQLTSFNFPKRHFGIKSVVYCSFQLVLFKQWAWIS